MQQLSVYLILLISILRNRLFLSKILHDRILDRLRMNKEIDEMQNVRNLKRG